MILTNFENLNSISNIFQDTHDFLVLTDPVIIYIYLRITTNRHFRDPTDIFGNVHNPTSKLLKCDLVQTLNTFRNPLCRFLLPVRHLLFSLRKRNISISLFLELRMLICANFKQEVLKEAILDGGVVHYFCYSISQLVDKTVFLSINLPDMLYIYNDICFESFNFFFSGSPSHCLCVGEVLLSIQ